MPTANLEHAATAAAETLIKYRVTSAPVAPLRILKAIPGVIVLSFTELASGMGMERRELLDQYGGMNRDAFTLVKDVNGRLRYFVAYNLLLPDYMLQRAIARELGILKPGQMAITGAELDAIPDETFANDVRRYSVYARVQRTGRTGTGPDLDRYVRDDRPHPSGSQGRYPEVP